MIGYDQSRLAEGLDDLYDLESALNDLESNGDRASIDRQVAETTSGFVESEIQRDARERAVRHVGEEATEIDARVLGWLGRSFRAGLNTDSEIVAAHEYGTGTHAGNGAYRIDNGGDEMAFEINGQPVVVEHVVHPGVSGKQMMQKAVEQNKEEFGEELAEEVADQIRDHISNSLGT